MIRAVTFDFWETLVHDTPEQMARQREMRLGAVRALLARAGAPCTAAAAETALTRCGAEMQERFWAADRDPSIRDQVRLFLDCIDPGLAARLSAETLEAAVTAYASPVLHVPPAIDQGAAEAVRCLAARGIALGIISNTGQTPGVVLRQVLARHDLLRYFGAISYSDEVGVRKPAPLIFERTLAALGAPAARALHVGDNPQDDVLGAKRFGMRAAHYAWNGREPSPDADVVVSDLAELPDRLSDVARA